MPNIQLNIFKLHIMKIKFTTQFNLQNRQIEIKNNESKIEGLKAENIMITEKVWNLSLIVYNNGLLVYIKLI